MARLEELTDDELRAELERRKQPKLKVPEQVVNLNCMSLRTTCRNYIIFVASDDYHDDNDYKHYIYETALETIYGKEIWDFTKKQIMRRRGKCTLNTKL